MPYYRSSALLSLICSFQVAVSTLKESIKKSPEYPETFPSQLGLWGGGGKLIIFQGLGPIAYMFLKWNSSASLSRN
jgi:hypothetical protein